MAWYRLVWVSSCGKFKSNKIVVLLFIAQVFSFVRSLEILFLHFMNVCEYVCARVLLLNAFALITTFYISTSTGRSNTTNINNQIRFSFSCFLVFVCMKFFGIFWWLLLLLLLLLLADFGWYEYRVPFFPFPFIFVNRWFHWRSTKFGVNKTRSVGYHGAHDWWITSRCHCNLLQFPFSLSHDCHRST